jgi:ArsR family transcriptional regulator, arsenate/arsenite/antimonite-responsive transcriptional repressor
MSDLFDALAHPVRREILSLLRRAPMNAGDLASHFDLAKPTLSGHFSVLKNAGLVTTERKGTVIIYRLNMSTLEEAVAALMAIASGKKGRAK